MHNPVGTLDCSHYRMATQQSVDEIRLNMPQSRRIRDWTVRRLIDQYWIMIGPHPVILMKLDCFNWISVYINRDHYNPISQSGCSHCEHHRNSHWITRRLRTLLCDLPGGVVDWVHNDLLSLANLGGHTAGRQPRAIAWKSSGCTQRANAEREAERVARRFCVCEYFGEDFGKYFQKHSTK